MVRCLRQLPNKEIENAMPVFGTEEFLSAKSFEYGWFISEDCALPFIVDARLCFKRIVFTTEPIRLRADVSAEEEARFLDEVVESCARRKDIRVDFIAAPQANAVFSVVPSGSEVVEWGSYVVDLSQNDSQIFNTFHPKHRNVIRKAVSSGVVISTTRDTELVSRIIRETMTRQKLLFFPSLTYLRKLEASLKGNIAFYTAAYEGKIQGVAVIVSNRLGGYYYYGGSIDKPFTGSLNLMQYEIMKDLRKQGIPVYDLMGARIIKADNPKVEGVQMFKRRFSSRMRRGYVFRVVFNPLRYRMFVFAVKTYFYLKGSHYDGDVIDQATPVQQWRRGANASTEPNQAHAASLGIQSSPANSLPGKTA